jgi:DNA-cytosine methyltransferase
MGLEVRPVFACDCDRHATTLCHHLWSHDMYFDNVFDVNFVKNAPTVDFFLAGFPCQPFSVQGCHLGTADPSNGTVIYKLLEYISKKTPRTFVLENVKGLVNQHPETLFEIMKYLRGLKIMGRPVYTVLWACLNAKNFGLPQNRERVVVVGLMNEFKIAEFVWPVAAPWLSKCGCQNVTIFELRKFFFGEGKLLSDKKMKHADQNIIVQVLRKCLNTDQVY